jgi:two-component system chemotaxis response regulator CheB
MARAPVSAATQDPEVKSLVAPTHLDPPPLLGTPSVLACPDCGGVLNEISDGVVRFRCHTGHAYSVESLLAGQTEGIEAALWASLRALEDKARLSEKLARHARERTHERSAERYTEQADTLQKQARLIRQMLTRTDAEGGD